MALFTFVSFVLFVLFVLDCGFKYASQMPGKATSLLVLSAFQEGEKIPQNRLSLMRMGRNPALPH